jgi:restriction system protein
MKNLVIRWILKIMCASWISFWITEKINALLYNHFHVTTPLTGLITPILMLSMVFCFKWIMNKIVIPIVLFVATGAVPAIILYFIGMKFKYSWLANQYLLTAVAVGIPASLGLEFFLNKYYNYFNAKSLEEIDKLGNGDPKKGGFLFEIYVASLYRKLGYQASTVAELKKQGKFKTKGFDQGADVVVDFIESGVKKRAVIQCKLYSDKVSNKAVQEVLASLPLYQADYGIVLTNNFFTDAAVELAEANKIIHLVDRKQLGALIEKAKNPKLHAMLDNKVAA